MTKPLYCEIRKLFCFNQFGDYEGAMLRPGNVPSAERWWEVLEPIVELYQKRWMRLLFRADAGFARPEVYEYLEPGDIGYAIRLPATRCCRSISNIC